MSNEKTVEQVFTCACGASMEALAEFLRHRQAAHGRLASAPPLRQRRKEAMDGPDWFCNAYEGLDAAGEVIGTRRISGARGEPWEERGE